MIWRGRSRWRSRGSRRSWSDPWKQAESDVRRLKEALVDQGFYAEENVHLLTGSAVRVEEQARKNIIQARVQDVLARRLELDDVLLVYLAMHGTLLKEGGETRRAFLPADAVKGLGSTYVTDRWLTATGTIPRTLGTTMGFGVRAPLSASGPRRLMPGVYGRPDRAAGIEKYRPVPGWGMAQPNNTRVRRRLVGGGPKVAAGPNEYLLE